MSKHQQHRQRGVIQGVLLSLLALALVALAGRAALQWELRQRTRLHGPRSMDQSVQVELNGRDQALYVRSADLRLPILLFLHGGPGFPAMPYTRELHPELPQHFTLVHWDQRGAGKSYAAGLPHRDLRWNDFIDDTTALIELLCARFQQEKIFLVGQSWGSLLGLSIAQRTPEQLWAYIGIAQIIDPLTDWRRSLALLRQRAQDEHKRQALAELSALSSASYNAQELSLKRKWAQAFGGVLHKPITASLAWLAFRSPEYSWRELGQIVMGLEASGAALNAQIQDAPWPFQSGARFETPIFFVQGRHDLLVPRQGNLDYFHQLTAPDKDYFWFEDSAHSPNKEEPQRYQELLLELKARVLRSQ